ncbi:MAG: peptide chain release factor N(5)-glutamine methyltransferase [Rhodobacteraceae bacterium]|nr:peptide chain release factor N(5)-glutamine methyltransferase [Paracoccaceae bacterium]
MNCTAAEVLRGAIQQLKPVLKDQAARDARVLLADALAVEPGRLTLVLPDLITADQLAVYKASLDRRLQRQPVSQIIGSREFWGRRFQISPDVLDPRPETETLIELALQGPKPGKLLDLGTGSGCIALTLLAEWPESRGVASDLSPAALEMARNNASAFGLLPRCDLLQSDWFSDIKGQFDLVVSNPPYITAAEMEDLEPEVARWEPRMALTTGDDGLAAYRNIAKRLQGFLTDAGRACFEIGKDQGLAVEKVFCDSGYENIEVHKDISGHDRVVTLSGHERNRRG